MKTKEYFTKDFEAEFEKAETITSLQELFKRMMIRRERWVRDSVQHFIPLLDEQMSIVEWELNKLRQSQSRGRYRAYYAFLKMLDEHYPYKTPVLRYRFILEDGVNAFKKEILSNMVHLSGEIKDSYLTQMKGELEGLIKNVYTPEDTLQEWYGKYNTSEKEVFAPVASAHRNLIYEMLKSSSTVFAGEDEFHIQNDFYNVFYGRAVREILNLVNAQIIKYEQRKKNDSPQSFDAEGERENQKEEEVKGLEDLFHNKTLEKSCIAALRNANPPVIDKNFHYVLGSRSKASVVAWVDAIKAANKVWNKINDIKLAALLNAMIAGLEISDRTLRSAQTKESALYKKYFRKYRDELSKSGSEC